MRILVATWGSYGDLHPALGLALGLRARGHDVVVATSPMFHDEVTREGLAFAPVGPDIDPSDRDRIARIMDPAKGSEYLFRQVLMPALPQAYADLRPVMDGIDLVISHPVTFAARLLAEELHVPWASMVLAPISFFSAHDMPVLPPAPWVKRIADRSPLIGRALVGLARRMTRSWSVPIAELRAARGLGPGGNPVFEGQHSPQLVLALFSRVLAKPQPDWPANVVVTGAITYNGPEPETLPPALEAFLATGSAPVVFTLGTSAVGAAGRFYAESAAAVRRIGRRAVLLVGRHPENLQGVDAGTDVIAVEYAPHAALFPRAAAIVHQGGAGTLHHALASGHPMIVVPHAHDQPDNADRARRLGVARVVGPHRYTAARVATTLAELLDDRAVATATARVSAVVRSEDGVRAACDAIDAQFTGSPVPSS
ncbi:MAG TPA: glycosyltransferase [Luteitalea sp.]|nr:glycosyltransferase [Luteitalea sp.]